MAKEGERIHLKVLLACDLGEDLGAELHMITS